VRSTRTSRRWNFWILFQFLIKRGIKYLIDMFVAADSPAFFGGDARASSVFLLPPRIM